MSLSINGLDLSHLMYADDVTFIGKWYPFNKSNLNRLLRCFYVVFGLTVNLQKSKGYGVRMEYNVISRLAVILNCVHGSFPFIYLALLI